MPEIPARVKQPLALIKDAFTKWRDDDPEARAASLAFFAIFSAAPALAMLAGLLGLIFGEAAAQKSLVNWVSSEISPQVAATLKEAMAQSINIDPEASWWTPIIALGVVLYASTRFFAQLQQELNRVWGMRVKERGLLIDFIRERAIALAMVLSLGVLTLVSLVLSAISSTLMGFLSAYLPVLAALAPLVDLLLTLLVMSLTFTLLFKIVPDAIVTWRTCAFGGVLTSLLFSIGKVLLSFYFSRFDPGVAFGTAGAILVFLVWIFYSCQIIFLGAELAHAYAEMRGEDIKPSEKARWLYPYKHESKDEPS